MVGKKQYDGSGGYTCARPSILRRGDKHQYQVPCGHCVPCISRRRDEWVGRILGEFREVDQFGVLRWPYRYFITLTYADGQFPWQPNRTDMRDGDGNLVDDPKRVEIQRFLKRLRYANYCRKTKRYVTIRYFAVGEYGDKTGRWHYHLIVWCDQPLKGWLWETVTHPGNPDHPPEWPHGRITVGEVKPTRIRYVASYVMKGSLTADAGRYLASMSRRPGIGRNWLEQFGAHCGDVLKRDAEAAGKNRQKLEVMLGRGFKHDGTYFPVGKTAWQWYTDAFLAAGGPPAAIEGLGDSKLYQHFRIDRERRGLVSSNRQSDVQLYDRERRMLRAQERKRL